MIPFITLNDSELLSSPTAYRKLVGALQYQSITRPDIAFVAFMHSPTQSHFDAPKCVLRYLSGTFNKGLLLRHDSPLNLHAFCDADWVSDKDTSRSTTGYGVYIGCNPIA